MIVNTILEIRNLGPACFGHIGSCSGQPTQGLPSHPQHSDSLNLVSFALVNHFFKSPMDQALISSIGHDDHFIQGSQVKHVVGSCLVGSTGGHEYCKLSAVVRMYTDNTAWAIIANCAKNLQKRASSSSLQALCDLQNSLLCIPHTRPVIFSPAVSRNLFSTQPSVSGSSSVDGVLLES